MRSRGTLLALALAVLLGSPVLARQHGPKAFRTPEDAARALDLAAKADGVDGLLAIFGTGGEELLASSDPVTAQRNRETFAVAFAEEWRIEDAGTGHKELVIGHESWPFPVPLAKTSAGWVFDVAAGKEEVLDRRIGRNELATLDVLQAYVRAQRAYAAAGHDGHAAGAFAQRFASDAGSQNGLYWPARRGEPRSPLGDLAAQAAEDGQPRATTPGQERTPFHGYFFRILEGQGPAAPGGARSYVVNGQMTDGFALVAWPAAYDSSGVVTFVINQDGIAFEKDLGPETAAKVVGLVKYDPDATWRRAVADKSAESRTRR